MTTTIVILLAGIAAAVSALLVQTVDLYAGPDPVTRYTPRHAAAVTARVPGATLDPVTMALPPADCNLADDVLERIVAGLRRPSTDVVLADWPVGASGKRHDPDWQFHTDAWEIRFAQAFADEPDNQAINLPWRGTGILPQRSPWGTPEMADEWAEAVA